jgi:hypothetical protein
MGACTARQINDVFSNPVYPNEALEFHAYYCQSSFVKLIVQMQYLTYSASIIFLLI